MTLWILYGRLFFHSSIGPFFAGLLDITFPALLPQATYLLLHDGKTENTYGLLVIIFLAFMSLSVFRLRNLVMKSISIQFKNISLLDDIEREKIQVSDLNKQLQGDLLELRQPCYALRPLPDKAIYRLLLLKRR